MTSRLRLLVLAAALPMMAACEHNYPGPAASNFGDANRMTMAAQVVNPDPQYDTLNPPTSGEHAGQAAERYRTDKVKQPVRETTSSGPN
ncbi:hypothetical protein GRI40_08395 [Altererythrobacter aerius]|uniref:Lipoprotein n=1 Tax=Tsuneonella aeria TaxID=1837929 RepID=A0A6I4TDU7_9SPHN|nr:hypothetical protein [Tsuneonella aeria]MXO75233.1 hypothetical protein [Tsuneonella aeria]